MKNKIRVAIIGCGNMAQAIINGLTNISTRAAMKAVGKEFSVIASDCDESKLLKVRDMCSVTLDNAEAVKRSDYVLLAVKPQIAERALSGLDLSDKVIISIMAGVTLSKIKEITHSDVVVRVMPNLCARVGESFNAYVMDGAFTDTQKESVIDILSSFGVCSEVVESDMDAVTGITGSGPAFVFMTIRAFAEKAMACGFSPEQAKAMAIQTIVGSALTAEKSQADFSVLVDSVCSKGGTTIEGVNYLNSQNYESILSTAIQKSIDRSREMSGNK